MNKSIGLSVVFGFLALILIAAFALSVAAQEANAASGINKSINYQGKLMDSAGNFVSDGVYNIKFTFYDAGTGGTQLWSASTTNGLPGGTPALTAVQVTNGLFSILLGDQDLGHVTIPEEIFNNDNVYLGVTIESDTEMLPRKRLSAVPYAFNAGALQGQKASSSVDNTGGELFRLSQIATDSASATRTALLIETYGTSNQYDFLLRLSDGTQDVFLVNRQGNVTTTGAISIGTALLIGGIQLDAIGSSATTSGAYLVGAYDEFTYSNATTVQGVLADLDLTLNSVSSSANTLTLQNVTDNGNTTTNPIVFAGGTSTGDLMPGAHLTYDLGRPGMRWDEIWVNSTKIGTDSWTIETDTNNTFLISEDTFGNYFAISEDGKVGIGTSTPSLFDLEVNGTVGPSQHNLYDLGSLTSSWRNILASGTVSSTDAIFGSADIGSLSVTNLIWLNATGTNSILGNLTVTSTLSLPNDSITDLMASDTLTIGPLGNVSATSINSGVLGNANVILSLDSFGQVTGSLPASQITLASTNTADSLDLQSYLNMLVANGRAFGGETTQTASGTVQVSAGQGLIASDPTNPVATVYYTSWATSSGISVPLFEWMNVYVHYDSGITSVVATTTDYGGNWTYYKLAMVYNEGDGYLHIHDERSIETRPINRIVDFLENGVGQIITEGCEISDVGTRNIAVSQCTNWYAAYERTVPAFDSSGIDTFDTYYSNGLGGFNHSHGFTQWDNLNYDNNSGTLQALAGDEYGVHWVYIHEHGAISLLYGQDKYTDLANARAAQAPTNLPVDFLDSDHAFLIGAIIFKQGQDNIEFIRDLRPVLVDRSGQGSGSGVVNHNDLAGIQGGTTDEYYHLTSTGFDADANLLFSANNGGTFGLEVNDINNKKITINNTFAGSASLDIIDGDLLLASTTRITNSGAGYLTNLNLSGNLYASGTALLSTLTVDSATSTNLFATNANITNLTAGLFNVDDLFWTNATGTNAYIANLTGDVGLFTDLIATNATFTQLVVMDNTTIENLTFGNATGGNLILSGLVSSTSLISGDAVLANTTMANATATNLNVETLKVGSGNFPVLGASLAQFGGDFNNYLVVNARNTNTGDFASANFTASADVATPGSNFNTTMGVANSGFNNAFFSLANPLDSYFMGNSNDLLIVAATSSSIIKFAAGGTTATDEVMRITSDHYVGIGTTTPSHTLDVDGDGRFTGLLTLSSATTSELFWGNATGTDLTVTSIARLPANTTIGSKSVCLLDGTNCPSGTTPNLQTITNTGNTTTHALQFAGGTSTADFRFQQGLTIDGVGAFQDFSFVNATGSNLVLSGLVSSTSLISGDAVLANTTMANATATNLNVETLKVGSGNFPVLGASLAQFGGDFNNYLVVNARNTNTGDFASANFTASADVATPGNNFNTTMGVANSGFNNAFFSLANPLDSYFMGNSNDLLIVAATSSSIIKFAAGGTTAANEVMRITSDHYVGIGTTTPAHTLDVDGDGRFTGLLTLSSATTSELFWRNATGSGLSVSSFATLPTSTTIGSRSVCLEDGTNCPSATSPDLQTVTNTGNSTTNWIEFAGGTSTGDFTIYGNLTVTGTSVLQHIDFITATGTALQLSDHLYLGNGSDTDINMISVDTGDGANNPSLKYYSNYYGYKGLIWHNPDSGESAMLASQSQDNDAEILAITGSRSQNAVFNLYSDTDGFSTFSGLRGWEVGRRGSDATFDFTFYNTDTGDGRSSMGPYQLLTFNGFDAEMILNGGAIFNEGGDDYDFRVEGDTEEYLLFIDASTERIGMGTSTPSEKLHVEGNIFASGTVSSTDALFVNSTGSRLDVTGSVRLPLDTRVNDTLLCLADGTNCPSSAASNLQTVTNAGNTTTHAIQFAGGTSTADFRFQQDVNVDGLANLNTALFINATGTNLAVLGYINSNLSPMASDTYTLGDASHRWQGLTVNYVTSTNILATGYVSSSAMYINGQAVTTSVSTLDQVTTQGNVTANAIQFGGGTSTGSILPGLTDANDLGSADYRWNEIYGSSFFVGTSTPWSITEEGNQAFSISNNGSEKARITADGNLYVGTTAYAGGLGATFSPNGNEILANGDIGAMGSVYAGTSFRAGATSTVYSKSSLYKQDGGDYLFQFADVAASPDLISGFELSFPPADWSTGGDANWFQDSSTSTQGTYSAQSGDINDLELNYIETNYTFSSDGILEFDWKVSSEASYDFLLFCLDDAINCTDTGGGDYARIDGETNWATVSVPITAGTHNLRWVYDKDFSVSNGSDAGWIDNVSFSPYSGQNWRFYTANTERLTVAYSGNVGIGIGAPTAKLDINGETKARGNVTVTAAPSKTEIAWTTTNKTTTGIESVRSLVTFNGYLYAGQGDGAGDGDIQVCNPAGGGDTTLCDNASDWSASYSGATYSQVLTMIVYKGRLYAGMGNGAGLGDVLVCDPTTTGSADICDAGDWTDASFPAGPNRINQLMVHNGYLYAANDTGASGSASVAICDPAGGGVATACDNGADWTNVTLPIAYEEANTLVSYLNTMYVFVGNSLDDSDFFYCDASAGGNVNLCDVAADWTRPFNNSAGAYEGEYSANVYNGYLYIGYGLSSGDGDLIRCEPQATGSDVLCDNAGDFTIVINNGGGFTRISALMNYDGSLFIGNEGATNNGDIYEFTGSNYKISDVATGIEATYAFAELNGVLYAGRGNATGNGQVYYYQKAREASHALRMEAGSSTGSMWFSSESLNYQGAGTDYEAQTGAFKFSHGLITEAGAYDLAEMYPTLDGGISAGEVVVLDKDNPGYIKKSDLAYAKNIVGVVSAKPGFLLSGKEKDKDLRAVALVGRVPVKVSLENGEIKVGDPLTSSAQPGYAMKALNPA